MPDQAGNAKALAQMTARCSMQAARTMCHTRRGIACQQHFRASSRAGSKLLGSDRLRRCDEIARPGRSRQHRPPNTGQAAQH